MRSESNNYKSLGSQQICALRVKRASFSSGAIFNHTKFGFISCAQFCWRAGFLVGKANVRFEEQT